MATNLTNIRAALETHLNTLDPILPIVWENTKPVVSTSFIMAFLYAYARNPVLGCQTSTRYDGTFITRLFYPKNTGMSAIESQAEIIIELFSITKLIEFNDVICSIVETPNYEFLGYDMDRVVGEVKIKFLTNLLKG